MVSLCRHAASTKTGGTRRRTIISHLLIAAILSLLFGLGWAFGFIGTTSLPPSVYVPAQYIFSIFIGIQGVLIFILHAIRSADSREEWKRWWYTLTCRSETYHVRRTMSFSGSGSTRVVARKATYLSDSSNLPRDLEGGKDVPLVDHPKAAEAASELSKVLDSSHAVENAYAVDQTTHEEENPGVDEEENPGVDEEVKKDLSEAVLNTSTQL